MSTKFEGTAEQRQALDIYIKLARAWDAVAMRTSVPVEDAGLTPTQFGVLETLFHLGRLQPSQLAQKHLKSRNNLTVVIDKLEAEGLVVRERCPSDRRAQWVKLTDAGRTLIENVLPKHVAAVEKDVSVLSCEEQKLLNDLLRKLGRGSTA